MYKNVSLYQKKKNKNIKQKNKKYNKKNKLKKKKLINESGNMYV